MEKLDLHGKTGFIIGGTRGIGTYKYHNTCAEAMLPLDSDAYIHVAPAGPADHVPYDEVEVFRVPKGNDGHASPRRLAPRPVLRGYRLPADAHHPAGTALCL